MLKLLSAFPVYTTCFSFLSTPQRIITKFSHKKFENLPPPFHLQILFSHLKHFLILLSFISVSSALIRHLLCQIKDANKYLILTNFISHLFPLKLPAHHLYLNPSMFRLQPPSEAPLFHLPFYQFKVVSQLELRKNCAIFLSLAFHLVHLCLSSKTKSQNSKYSHKQRNKK